MKIGAANIDDSQYGMPILHMEALQRSAEAIGPLGVRPVSKFALTFIQEGNPTKPFNVKNKSANAGPPAGLIAVDPLFARGPLLSASELKFTPEKQTSVLAAKQKTYALVYGKQINDAIEKDMFKTRDSKLKDIDLKIKPARLQELTRLDKTMKIEEIQDSAQSYQFKITWGESYNPRVAYAKADENFMLQMFDAKNNPIKILGRSLGEGDVAIVEKGITADYDLLVVCPAYKDFEPGGVDKSPFRTQGMLESAVDDNQTVLAKNAALAVKGVTDIPMESPTGGNWSKRVEEAVATINTNIAKIDPMRNSDEVATVHHNTEFTNPFADDLKNSIPCLFLLPRAMDISSVLKTTDPNATAEDLNDAKTATVVLIESVQEMNLLRNVFRNEGYYWPANARYADTIQPFRPEVMELMQADSKFTAEQKVERASRAATGSTSSILMGLNAPIAPSMNKVTEKKEVIEPVAVVKVDLVKPAPFSTKVAEELNQTSDAKPTYTSIRP